MVDTVLDKVFKGNVFHDTAADIWTSPALNPGTILSACHLDISVGATLPLAHECCGVYYGSVPRDNVLNYVENSRELTQRAAWQNCMKLRRDI